MAESGFPQRLHEDSRGVVDDEIVLGNQLVAFLKENAEAAEPAVMNKCVAAKLDLVRVHNGRARYVVSEIVVLENVLV